MNEEDAELKQTHIDGAEELRHVNEMVLEDVEDFYLLQGFPKSVSAKDINAKIAFNNQQRRERAKMLE